MCIYRLTDSHQKQKQKKKRKKERRKKKEEKMNKNRCCKSYIDFNNC